MSYHDLCSAFELWKSRMTNLMIVRGGRVRLPNQGMRDPCDLVNCYPFLNMSLSDCHRVLCGIICVLVMLF